MSRDIHGYLRAHRERCNLTLKDVAAASGFADNTISQWETAVRPMKLEHLKKLAEIYGVSPPALLMAPEDAPRALAMREAADLAAKLPADDLAEWIKLGRRLSPDHVKQMK